MIVFIQLATFLFLSTLADNLSFVETAPFDVKNDNEKFYDKTVKELENLKNIFKHDLQSNDDGISVSKVKTSFFSEVNGQKSGFKETKNEVNKNGQLVAKVIEKVDLINGEGKPNSVSKTEIEIPAKGIHEVIVKNGQNEKEIIVPSKKQEANNIESNGKEDNKVNKYSGIDYSPLDMAEYIFWTGDEKGVASTIEEFLEYGLMSREEAINFLQSIKFNLDFIQHHYQGMDKINKQSSNNEDLTMKESKSDTEKPMQYENIHSLGKLKSDGNKEEGNMNNFSPFDSEKARLELFKALPLASKVNRKFNKDRSNMENIDKNEEDYENKGSGNIFEPRSSKRFFKEISRINDEDYEDVIERLKVVDFLYREYSLEEVIYQLAKVLFSQSLTNRSKEGQKALEKFIMFLHNEVKYGEISKRLEDKILDVLVTALVDTVSEHPEVSKEELDHIIDPDWPTSSLLKQILMAGMESRSIGNANVKEDLPKKALSEEKLSDNSIPRK